MHRNLYKKTQTKLFTENRLCFFNTLRSNISEVPGDHAEFHLSYMFNKVTVKNRQVSLQDFILRNTLDSSTSIVDTITFGSNRSDRVTFANFQSAVQKQFNGQPFAIYMQGKSLDELIKTWVETNADVQERRSFELSLIQPTNIEVVRYKFQELMKYNSIPMWNYIEDYDTATRTQLFMDDPILASQVLESLFVCEPDTLLVSVLSGIRSDLGKPANETPDQKTNREAACKILSSVCDILNRYSMGYNAGTSIGSSMGEVMNPMASMGFLSGMPELSGSLFDNFGKMSGSEKAIGLIGALIASRAVGHNFPKVSAAIKTGIVAALGAPIVAHLGSKLMHGRSYLEFRKIRALLGGSESNDPTNLIAQICGFDLSAATSDSAKAAIKSNIEGLIDSVVAHESFGNLKFRDVIHAFEPGGNSDSVVTGHIRTTPQIASSLSVVIPRMIAKFENEETPPLARARFYHLMTSQKTWSEGMFLLLSQSEQLNNLLAGDEMEAKVTQNPEITPLDEDLADDAGVSLGDMGVDVRVQEQITVNPTHRLNHINLHIGNIEQLSGHYYSSFFREVNEANTIGSIATIKTTTDTTHNYASFKIQTQLTEANLKLLYDKVKSKITENPNNGNPESLRLVFAGSESSVKTPLIAGFTWLIDNESEPNQNLESIMSDEIANEQLVSLDNDIYGNRTLRLYSNIFRNETEGNSNFISILNDPRSLTIEQINDKLPDDLKLNNTRFDILKASLIALKGYAPTSINILSIILSGNAQLALDILCSNDPNTTKLLKIYRIWKSTATPEVSTERDRRIEILNRYLDLAKSYLSNMDTRLTGNNLLRAQAILEFYALKFACDEIQNPADRKTNAQVNDDFELYVASADMIEI